MPTMTVDLKRLEKDIFTAFMFQGRESNPKNYDPKLYIPHPNFKPEEGPPAFKTALREFRFEIEEASKILTSKKKKNVSNLPWKYHLNLRKIRNSREILVTATDKNLGAAIIDTKTYIRRNLQDHLLKDDSYSRFSSKEEAQTAINTIYNKIVEKVKQREFPSGVPETYLSRIYMTEAEKGKILPRPAKYYALPKIHKKPWSLRPVVSQCGFFLEGLSKWLDFELQKVKHLCPAYLKDSWALKEKLEVLTRKGLLNYESRLITADAVAMYPSIDTDHGLETMSRWLQLHEKDLPKGFPSTLVIQGLHLVMKNNIFEFGNTYWLQLKGTAIGTSVACMYATIYFSFHEETVILPSVNARQNVLLYVRFIDDVFAILKNEKSAKILDEQLNSFGDDGKRLTWETSNPSRETTFLDLTIKITSANTIITTTFQKPMNNHLYLPQESAHQKSVHQGIIKSQIWRYFNQNSRLEDFQIIVGEFFKRLIRRGHKKKNLKEMFLKAAKEIEAARRNKNLREDSSKKASSFSSIGQPARRPIFLHVQHHPQGLQNNIIKRLFEHHCLPTLKSMPNEYGARIGSDGVILATHRTKKISKLVKRSKLRQDRFYDVLVSNQIDILAATKKLPVSPHRTQIT